MVHQVGQNLEIKIAAATAGSQRGLAAVSDRPVEHRPVAARDEQPELQDRHAQA